MKVSRSWDSGNVGDRCVLNSDNLALAWTSKRVLRSASVDCCVRDCGEPHTVIHSELVLLLTYTRCTVIAPRAHREGPAGVTHPTVRGIDDPVRHATPLGGGSRAPTSSLSHDSRPLFNGRRRGGLHACPAKAARIMLHYMCATSCFLQHALLEGQMASGTRAWF
eukprot:5166265-Prymnesium_polylepis.1